MRLSVGILAAFLLMAGTAQSETRDLDLSRAYELSVLTSETLGERDEDIKAARARYWQAIGEVLPSAKLVMIESFENKKSYGNSVAFGTQSQEYFETKLHARQTLFAGFREFTAASGYKSEIYSKQYTKTRTAQVLYLEVTQAFYQALAHQADIKVLNDLIGVLEARDGELKKRIKLGKSRESEALQSRAGLAETRILVEDAEGLYVDAMELLAYYTGVPAEEMALIDTQQLPTTEQLRTFIERLGGRPDIKAAQADETFSRKKVAVVKGEYLPTIWAEGNWYAVKSPDSERDWDALLTLELPFLEGGKTTAKLREEKANLRISELNVAQLKRQANRETRVAYNDFMTAVDKKLRVEEALTVADQNYKVQKSDFNLNRSTNLDVLQALRTVYELKRRLIAAEAEIKISHVRLHVASGSNVPVGGSAQ